MKEKMKQCILIAGLSLSFAISMAGISTILANAEGEETTLVSTEMTMEHGASLYLKDVSGLKFTYTVADYDAVEDADRNFGMLIVPYDYLAKAGITDLTNVENDYITTLKAAVGDTVTYAPITVDGLIPNANGQISYSIGNLYEENYTRAFFGIGYETISSADGDTYLYAQQDDNVRSVFEVANLALNKLHDADAWTDSAEDVKEKALLESKEADVLNPFITKGFAFVYGDAATPTLASATYVGGEIVPEVEIAKEKEIDLGIHWMYSVTEGDTVAEITDNGTIKGLTRGQTAITMSLGEAVQTSTKIAVLKDETEWKSYNASERADFFGVEDTSFAGSMVTAGKAFSTIKLDGGYWNGPSDGDGFQNPGHFVIQNPDSADGKYTLNSTGILLDFYFTGNNMPNVEFFGTKLEGIDFGKYGGGTSGYMVSNGIARSNTYSEYVNTVQSSYDAEAGTYDTSGWKINSDYQYYGIVGSLNFFRFGVSAYGKFNRGNYNKNYDDYFASSYALDDTNKTSGYNIMKYASSMWSSGAATYGTKLSQFELMQQGEEKNWHYQVTIYLSSNKPKWSARIYEVAEDGTETLYHNKAAKLVVNSTASNISGYITVYGALKGSKTECTNAGNADYYYTEVAYKLPSKSKFTS